jgi:methyl-accepting chemotaxis protein
MKPITLLVATGIVVALILSPMVAYAASISFTSPASGTTYKGTQSYSITGAVSPIPSQPDNVFVTVKNPSGTTVDAASVSVSLSTGTFDYATATGGSANWVTGTYTITATDSYGATGSTTFAYQGAPPPTSYNVTKALVDIEGNLTQIKSEISSDFAVLQNDNKGNFSAMSSALTAMSTQLTNLAGQVTTISTNLGTVQTDVTNMQGQLTTISNNITTLNSAVQSATSAAQAAQTAAQNANNAVSSTQTYVLVVAVLAAITLVLELAILVRKLS